MDRLAATFRSLTPRGRIVLAASAAGVLLFAFFFLKLATSPSYTTLVTGVDPADTGKITSTLSEKGIKYELQNNGTAVGVEKGQVADARIAIAEKGLPGTSQPGYELFDKQKLGTSDFQNQVTYQRALEGEIARTIGEIDGLSGAQVQLTLPDDKLFADEQKPATAAVLLTSGVSLEPSTVQGIARLTASSVEGLKPENVTITDSAGELLWPNGDSETGSDVGGHSKQAVEARYENTAEARLNAMLVQTVGPGKARVQVNADVNADTASQEKLEYAKKGTPLTEHSEKETLAGGGTGGAAGTAGNIPSYAQTTTAGGSSNYKRQTTDRNMGVGKTVTHTQIAPGKVEKQSVALVLDKSVEASTVAEIRRAVESAAGIDTKRGDTLSVSQVPFAKVETPGAGPVGGMMGILKYVGLGIGSLIFLFLLTRQLRKREDEELMGEPVWLREIQAPATLAQLEADTFVQPQNRHQVQLYQGQDPATQERAIVEQAEPERIASQVRAWMKQ
jgi:flagellar M-ring protein FliF